MHICSFHAQVSHLRRKVFPCTLDFFFFLCIYLFIHLFSCIYMQGCVHEVYHLCVNVFIVNILSFIRVKSLSLFLCPSRMSSHIRWSLLSLSVRWHLIGHAHIIQPILFFHSTWVGSQGYELRKKTAFLFSL